MSLLNQFDGKPEGPIPGEIPSIMGTKNEQRRVLFFVYPLDAALHAITGHLVAHYRPRFVSVPTRVQFQTKLTHSQLL